MQTEAIWDKQNIKFSPVERVVKYVNTKRIWYLKDGGYIRLDTGNYFELVSETGIVIHKTTSYDSAILAPRGDNSGTRLICLFNGRYVILDVARDTLDKIYIDDGPKLRYPPLDVGRPVFGRDWNEIFCYDKREIYRLEYIPAEKNWRVAQTISLKTRFNEGSDMWTMFYIDESTLIIFTDTRDQQGSHTEVWSVDISNGNLRFLVRLAYSRDTPVLKMITPSYFAFWLKFTGGDSMYDINLNQRNHIVVLDQNGADAFFSPDGRDYIRSPALVQSISPDGRRINSRFEEIILKNPLVHPVYTHVYGDHRWIRLMSDLTLETHDTHPAVFLIIKSLTEAIAKAKERAPGDELALPILAWAYNLTLETPFTTVEKAKRGYFKTLVALLAKGMGINSTK